MKNLSKVTLLIFHPLLLPIYGIVIFFKITPLYIPSGFHYSVILASLLLGVIAPLIIYTTLHFINWIPSNFPRTKRQREYLIFSYSMILMILYYKIFLNNSLFSDLHLLVSFFLLGYGFSFIWSLLGKKVSIRIMGMGCLISFIVGMGYIYKNNYTTLISFLVLLSSWVFFCQNYFSKYSSTSILIGFLLGIVPQFCFFYWYS